MHSAIGNPLWSRRSRGEEYACRPSPLTHPPPTPATHLPPPPPHPLSPTPGSLGYHVTQGANIPTHLYMTLFSTHPHTGGEALTQDWGTVRATSSSPFPQVGGGIVASPQECGGRGNLGAMYHLVYLPGSVYLFAGQHALSVFSAHQHRLLGESTLDCDSASASSGNCSWSASASIGYCSCSA